MGVVTAFADNFLVNPGLMNGRLPTTPIGSETWNDFNAAGSVAATSTPTPGFIRNPAGNLAGGVYCEYALDKPVTSMSASVRWFGPSSVGVFSSCVLIFGAQDIHGGAPPNIEIFENAAHFAFDNEGLTVTTFTAGVQSGNVLLYKYSGGSVPVDGTAFNIGIEIRGQIISCICPDGTTQKCASPLFAAYQGPYLIFQCFDATNPATYDGGGHVTGGLQPGFNSVAATTDPLAGYVPPWPVPLVRGTELEPCT